ncbi:hypothetical protein EVC30_084 [Rhizobium phage RHph_Y1_11]|nr:hypothetical protein EVC30_084 [Rhizobium phage RHph_Y1_11]
MKTMSWEDYKAKAHEYAEKEYALDANAIEDEWHTGSHVMGISPEDSVDAFARKYDLDKVGRY